MRTNPIYLYEIAGIISTTVSFGYWSSAFSHSAALIDPEIISQDTGEEFFRWPHNFSISGD